MSVEIREEPELTVGQFIDILDRSGLAERRPVADRDRIAGMLAGAGFILTAREAGRLVGVSRCITDFAYCCYCSDLAVDSACQGRGIGRQLIAASRERAGPDCSFFLISAPAAVSFYERIDMPRIERAYGWL